MSSFLEVICQFFITTERQNIFNSLVLQYIIVTSLSTNVPELRRGQCHRHGAACYTTYSQLIFNYLRDKK